MFKNKHLIAALLISPILAILSYYAVDAYVSETPHSAKAGNDYVLVAKSNCRYSSGRCSLKNGEFEAHVTLLEQPQGWLMEIESVFPLDGARVSLTALGQSEDQPTTFKPANGEHTLWHATFDQSYVGTEVMRVVLTTGGAFYYGETVAAFAHYETSYGKDFRQDR